MDEMFRDQKAINCGDRSESSVQSAAAETMHNLIQHLGGGTVEGVAASLFGSAADRAADNMSAIYRGHLPDTQFDQDDKTRSLPQPNLDHDCDRGAVPQPNLGRYDDRGAVPQPNLGRYDDRGAVPQPNLGRYDERGDEPRPNIGIGDAIGNRPILDCHPTYEIEPWLSGNNGCPVGDAPPAQVDPGYSRGPSPVTDPPYKMPGATEPPAQVDPGYLMGKWPLQYITLHKG
jgi:hypothetical protein